jgi:peptidoglycan/LPS O-acetylase OafA/YrhL
MPAESADTRKQFLDGIRGWAALQVALYHLIVGYLAKATPAYDQAWIGHVLDGKLAIYVFFVVSAFALSIGFIETKNPQTLETLALRRYPRLAIPILGCSLLGLILMWFNAVHNVEVAALLPETVWPTQVFNFEPSLLHALQFSLFDVFFRYDPNHSYSTALWTMSIELYGSFLVFVFLYCFRRAAVRYCLYPLCIYAAWRYDSSFAAFFFGMLLADGFAWIEARGSQDTLAILCLSIACLALGLALVTFGRILYGHPAFLSLCAFLFVGGIATSPLLRRGFGSKISHYLGRISFPLYLTHIAVISSVSSYLYLLFVKSGMAPTAAVNWVVVISLPVLFAAATAFYPVEAYAIRVSRNFSGRVMAWKNNWVFRKSSG